jgi:hypothetical protein
MDDLSKHEKHENLVVRLGLDRHDHAIRARVPACEVLDMAKVVGV